MTEAKQFTIEELPISPVDPHSPVPLYHQITLDLRLMIHSGQIPPGAVLPPELEICKAYHVGRQTVRMAIAQLVDENLVERFAGRGTFVKAPADRMQFYLDRSFTQQMKEMGYQAHSQVLSSMAGQVEATASGALARYAGQPCLTLVRRRYGNDIPIAIQTTTILLNQCPDLGRHDFSRVSLYEVLAREYHLVIAQIHHVVRAISADEYLAEMLAVPAGAPLLFVHTTAYTEGQRVVEATASYYRGDKYQYSTTHTFCE